MNDFIGELCSGAEREKLHSYLNGILELFIEDVTDAEELGINTFGLDPYGELEDNICNYESYVRKLNEAFPQICARIEYAFSDRTAQRDFVLGGMRCYKRLFEIYSGLRKQ